MAPGHQAAITPTALQVEVAVGGQTVANRPGGPIPDAKGITGLMCFYSERADIVVEGQAQS